MTESLAFRAEPLSPPRRPPQLAWNRHPRDAVIVAWRPRPGGALDLACVLVVSEGRTVAEYLVVNDPTGSRVAGFDDAPANVDTGGDPHLHTIDSRDLGKLLDRRSYRAGATVVTVDLLGLLGSLGENWTESRERPGAFAIVLDGRCKPGSRYGAKYRDAPRVIAQAHGPGILARWAGAPAAPPPGEPIYRRLRGPLVDITQTAGVFAGRRFIALDDTLTAWGLPPVNRDGDNLAGELRSEARAVLALHLAVVDESETWAIPTRLGDLLTPGSLAGRLLARTGVPSLAGRFDTDLSPRLRAAGAASYAGAIHHAGIVGAALPVVHADISSAYPRCASALDATRYLTAESVEPVDVTVELAGLLASPDLAALAVDRATWQRYGVTLARVRPAGDVLPVRQGAHLRLAPLDLDGDDAWWSWHDLAASTLRTGRPPELVEAIHLRPTGRVPRIHPMTLPSGRVVDLRRPGADLFAELVTERDRIGALDLPEHVKARRVAACKALTNSLYGALARVDRQRVAADTTDEALGFDGERLAVRSGTIEVPGPWTWLPLAAAITAGCRLVVGSVVAEVDRRGGAVVHVAADAVTVLAAHESDAAAVDLGGTDRRLALPVAQLDEILARTDALLDPTCARPGFKREHGWDRPAVAVVTGTNRLAIHDAGSGETLKATTAHLGGQALDPTGRGVDPETGEWLWATELHSAWAAHRLTGGGWPPPTLPEWVDSPRLRSERATTPDKLRQLAAVFPDVDVRPGARYVSTGAPVGARRALSLDAAPQTWATSTWHTVDGDPVRLDPGADPLDPDTLRPATFRGMLRRWTVATDGLRHPSPIRAPLATARAVGVDSGYLTAAADGDDNPEQARSTYGHGSGLADALRRRADAHGIADAGMVANVVGVPRQTLQAVLAGDRRPSPSTAAAIRAALADPDRWPAPTRLRICPVDRRHRWTGALDTCPTCGGTETTTRPAAICGECLTTFIGTVPIPCPICARKGIAA